jgi:hypothetical protein
VSSGLAWSRLVRDEGCVSMCVFELNVSVIVFLHACRAVTCSITPGDPDPTGDVGDCRECWLGTCAICGTCGEFMIGEVVCIIIG